MAISNQISKIWLTSILLQKEFNISKPNEIEYKMDIYAWCKTPNNHGHIRNQNVEPKAFF